MTQEEQLLSFEEAFFKDPRRRRNPKARNTWDGAYKPYLNRLRISKGSLTSKKLMKVLQSYEDGSRSRQQCGTALKALAEHLGIDLPKDWSAESGGYGMNKSSLRSLPSDEQIVEVWSSIPREDYRNAYALMATYGLRNHEVFMSDLGEDNVLRVIEGTKTGEHLVWPFNPEWVERFNIHPRMVLPQTTATTPKPLGRRISEQFNRYGLPFKPYDLRHAWAVRTCLVGLADTVAARMMGHSVQVHTNTYHHWITRRDQQQAVDAALNRT